ncbi:MAG: hypothetical protein RLZZ292_3630 [Bacteroidota bacterium]|jgi:hypothetical protein
MKKITLYLLFLISSLGEIKATKINASTFGYNATDATTAFQNAIQSSYDTIVVNYTGTGSWIVQPCSFSDLSNKTIIFQNNVQLVAKVGAFSNTGDCLFRLIRATNIKIWGYGATFKMQKSEYTTGEWRHALSICNSNSISVKGLTLKDSGGDGIYVSGETWFGTQLYSNNVTILDCISDNNRRQGMSVVSAQNLTVENCTFKNTIGTAPEAGLDLEPDNPQHRIVNILFKNCTFNNNNGKGIQLSLNFLDATSLPVSATFNNCYLTSNYTTTNAYEPGEISANSATTNFPTGLVTFNNCTVENSQWSAFASRKQADSYQVVFNNSHFKNVSQTQQAYNTPIWLEVCDYSNPNPAFGGVAFNNVCIEFTTQFAFLHANGWATSTGLKNVTGNLGVINSYQLAPVYSNVASQNNVTFTYAQGCASVLAVEYLEPLSAESIAQGVLLHWATATERNNAFFDLERSKNGIDFEKIVTINGKNKYNKTEQYSFLDKNYFENQNYYRLRQTDTDGHFEYSNIVVVNKEAKTKITISPNPIDDVLKINIFNEKIENAIILNANGQIVKSVQKIENSEINVQDLPKGIYFLELKTEHQNNAAIKFIKI